MSTHCIDIQAVHTCSFSIEERLNAVRWEIENTDVAQWEQAPVRYAVSLRSNPISDLLWVFVIKKEGRTFFI